MERLLFPLIIGLLFAGCSSIEEDRKKYQWEIEKSISMYKFLLNDDLEEGKSYQSIEYINYIACLEKSKRHRVGFLRAKMSCSEETKFIKKNLK